MRVDGSANPTMPKDPAFISQRVRTCKVPIWASSIGPSRHALLAGGLLGHGTSGEMSGCQFETGADRT